MLSKTMFDFCEYARIVALNKSASNFDCFYILYAMSVVDNEAKKFLHAFGLGQFIEALANG